MVFYIPLHMGVAEAPVCNVLYIDKGREHIYFKEIIMKADPMKHESMKWPTLRLFELPILLGLLLAVFCSGINSVSFHSDESQWIATSSFFEAFITGDFDSP